MCYNNTTKIYRRINLKSFYYNTDGTQFLVPLKLQTKTEVFFDWEINFLKDIILTSAAPKKEINNMLQTLKDFATSCSGFKDIKANDTNSNLAQVIAKYVTQNKAANAFPVLENQSICVGNYLLPQYYNRQLDREKCVMYGSAQVGYENTSIVSVSLEKSTSIGDSTPNYRVDVGRLKKQQSFSSNAQKLQTELTAFLEKHNSLGKSVSLPASITVSEYYGHNKKETPVTIEIKVSQVVKRLGVFIDSINNFIEKSLKDSIKIDIDSFKEMEWKGSLADINSFTLSQAFYLIGNNRKGENGFIGLMPTQHSYSDFFRFGIVKDIANAHLFHKMPPSSLTHEFSPISQVNVDIDFKSVNNADKNPAATLIDSFIIKAKLENSILSLTPRQESEPQSPSPKKNKI